MVRETLPDLGALAEDKLSYTSQLGKKFEGEELSVGQWQRLSIIRHATRILVMDQGRIVDDGTHQEFMRRCDLYHEMFTAQSDKYIREEETGS